MITELENPYILLFDKKISNLQEILPILEPVSQSGRSLLIIAEDFEIDELYTEGSLDLSEISVDASLDENSYHDLFFIRFWVSKST